MTIALTHHTTGRDDGTQTSFLTPSVSPTASRLIIALYDTTRTSSTNPADPTVSGNGLTWAQINSHLWVSTGSARRKMWIFAADTGVSPSAGAITFDHGVNHIDGMYSVFELSGTDLPNAVSLADLFVQVVKSTANPSNTTSVTLNLAAAGASDNRPFMFTRHLVGEGTTPRTNWTEIGDFDFGTESQWRSDAFETTASASWATPAPYGAMAFEVKAAAEEPPLTEFTGWGVRL